MTYFQYLFLVHNSRVNVNELARHVVAAKQFAAEMRHHWVQLLYFDLILNNF